MLIIYDWLGSEKCISEHRLCVNVVFPPLLDDVHNICVCVTHVNYHVNREEGSCIGVKQDIMYITFNYLHCLQVALFAIAAAAFAGRQPYVTF